MKPSRTRSGRIALTAVFAALYFVLRSVPIIQMIGVSGRFTAGDFLLTTIALVAGPWGGALSVAIGTVLAYPISGTPLLGLDFLPGVMNVLIVGLILSNRRRIARATYAAVLLLFVASPYSLLFGYGTVPYTWLHIVALGLLLSPVIGKVPQWIVRNGNYQLAAVATLAFVGTMAQHLTGGLLFELAVGLIQGNSPTILKGDWQIIFWLYPAERLVITVVSTVISVGLVRSLRLLTAQLATG